MVCLCGRFRIEPVIFCTLSAEIRQATAKEWRSPAVQCRQWGARARASSAFGLIGLEKRRVENLRIACAPTSSANANVFADGKKLSKYLAGLSFLGPQQENVCDLVGGERHWPPNFQLFAWILISERFELAASNRGLGVRGSLPGDHRSPPLSRGLTLAGTRRSGDRAARSGTGCAWRVRGPAPAVQHPVPR